MNEQGNYSFEYKRPLYYSKDSKLVDIISSELYSDFKAAVTDFAEYTKKDYNRTIDTIVDSKLYQSIGKIFVNKNKKTPENKNTNGNKDALKALSLGLGISAISNYLVTSLVADKGLDYSVIDWDSFLGEQVPHTLISASYFVYSSLKRGRTFNETWKELAYIIAPISSTLTFIPYRLSRNLISNTLMDWDVLPPVATLIAQAALFLPYLFAVKYSLKAVKSTECVQKKLEAWHQEGLEIEEHKKKAA